MTAWLARLPDGEGNIVSRLARRRDAIVGAAMFIRREIVPCSVRAVC